MLPFKSSLLEPAARHVHRLTAGHIRYDLQDGNVSEEVCYWKNMTFVPHLLNLLGKRSVRTVVAFRELRQESSDRKKLARQLHAEVLRLKETIAVSASLSAGKGLHRWTPREKPNWSPF